MTMNETDLGMNLINQDNQNDDAYSHVYSSSKSMDEYVLKGEELAKLLVQTLLPSFGKEIQLNALIAYQIDGKSNKSVVVNRRFRRMTQVESEGDNKDLQGVTKRPCYNLVIDSKEHSLTEHSHTGQHDETNAPIIALHNEIPLQSKSQYLKGLDVISSSRRKRKFCKPSKIPQAEECSESCSATSMSMCIKPEDSDNDAMDTQIVNVLDKSLQISKFLENPLWKEDNQNSLKFCVMSEASINSPKSVHIASPQVSLHRPIRPRILPSTLQSMVNTAYKPRKFLSPSTEAFSNNSTRDSLSMNRDFTFSSSRRCRKSFTCNQCHSIFTSLSSLCEHTFTKHRAFRCTRCGAEFTQRSNLQRHSLRHVGFKPFICSICSKAYFRKDHLIRHIELLHPDVSPRSNVIVKLSSADCLEYLDGLKTQPTPEIKSKPIKVEGSQLNCHLQVDTFP